MNFHRCFLRCLHSAAQHRLDSFQNGLDSRLIKPYDLNDTVSTEAIWHTTSFLLNWALELELGNKKFGLSTQAFCTETGFRNDFLLLDSDTWQDFRRKDLEVVGYERLLTLDNIQGDIKDLTLGKHGSPIFLGLPELKSLRKSIFKLMNTELNAFLIPQNEAFKMFAYNPFQLHQITKVSKGGAVKIVKAGDFIDISTGPILKSPKFIKAIYLEYFGAVNFENCEQQVFSRIGGVAFQSKQDLQHHRDLIAEAEKRDHRLIGQQQKLFMFSEFSPGSPIILPHGVRIIEAIKSYLNQLYRRYGYHEVITPLIFDKALWETSGHWANYKDDMFTVASNGVGNEKEKNCGLKPMNCPGHCIIYNSDSRSYRDLPIRYVENSPLHRNEASGALTGLFRVRKFHQDDAHIFCTSEQMQKEIQDNLEFLKIVYAKLGFQKIDFALSTRPISNYIGEKGLWDSAEEALTLAMNNANISWYVKEGDGAFYGPKIDVMVSDALGRKHQTATIQLDFQLPIRFNLKYTAIDGSSLRPVIIHRAILGSLERMLGILIEHHAGKWPFWLSPRQLIVITTRLDPKIEAYAQRIKLLLSEFHTDTDFGDRSLPKKIFEANKLHYNFGIIIGDQEVANQTVCVRNPNGSWETIAVLDIVQYFRKCNSL